MTPMKPKKIFKVVVALTTQTFAGQRKLAGIFRFLGGKYLWDLTLLRSAGELTEDLIERTRNTTDGYLISLHEQPSIRDTLIATGKPIVFIEDKIHLSHLKARNISFLEIDQRAIGRRAARHLLGSGSFESFAFVHAKGNLFWSNGREAGFRGELQRRHCTCASFSSDDPDEAALQSWLKALPKPTAVFAAFDDRAVEVMDACRAEGIRVPQDAMVVGAGNDELLCMGCRPTLSSVAIPFEEHGYIAARELQARMIAHPNRQRVIATTNEFEVSKRKSTAGKSDIQPLVQDALAYIRTNALSGIKVPDVVAHLRVSRRLADLRFRQVTGKSILQAIVETQVNEAKRLLSKTDLPVAAVALKCGFRSPNYFKNVFVRVCGMPPRAWRGRHPRD